MQSRMRDFGYHMLQPHGSMSEKQVVVMISLHAFPIISCRSCHKMCYHRAASQVVTPIAEQTHN
jgi:hypothetical protein